MFLLIVPQFLHKKVAHILRALYIYVFFLRMCMHSYRNLYNRKDGNCFGSSDTFYLYEFLVCQIAKLADGLPVFYDPVGNSNTGFISASGVYYYSEKFLVG